MNTALAAAIAIFSKELLARIGSKVCGEITKSADLVRPIVADMVILLSEALYIAVGENEQSDAGTTNVARPRSAVMTSPSMPFTSTVWPRIVPCPSFQ